MKAQKTFFLILFVFITLLILYLLYLMVYICIEKENISNYMRADRSDGIHMKFRGLGMLDKKVGLLGYIPTEFVMPLKNEYPKIVKSFMIDEIRRISVKKILNDHEAICEFEDFFQNRKLRAKGNGIVTFDYPFAFCEITKYHNIIFFDLAGHELSKICNGEGSAIIIDNLGNKIVEISFTNGFMAAIYPYPTSDPNQESPVRIESGQETNNGSCVCPKDLK